MVFLKRLTPFSNSIRVLPKFSWYFSDSEIKDRGFFIGFSAWLCTVLVNSSKGLPVRKLLVETPAGKSLSILSSLA